MLLTAVIPVFNERESLAPLHRELDQVAAKHNYEMQIIFVDDGSSDGSWREIEEIAAEDDRVLGIRFRRNFGKAAALAAGFDAAEGDLVLTLDADLQDDPAELPRLIATLEEGYDVVSGWKALRHDPWHKRWPSKAFNWLVGRLTKVRLHDHNCGLKCYRRDVIREIRLYGELHRFVPVLAAARGFRIGELAVNHRPRKHGHSKYGIERIVKGFLDLMTVKFVTGYGHRPQHLLGTIGLGSFFLGVVGMIYLAALWVVSRLPWSDMQPVDLHARAALYYSLGLMLVGAQFLSTGLLAELVAAYLSRDVDSYSISQYTSVNRESSQREQGIPG